MRRIVAFSPATALSKSSHFDSQQGEWDSPELKSQQLKWTPSPGTKADITEGPPSEPDFDQCELIGAFRLVSPNPAQTWSDPGQTDQRWTDRFHELPLEHIVAFLTMSDLCSASLTSRRWGSALSRAPVWRMMFARKSYPQMISQRSHAQSWRSLCLGGPRFSISQLLSLQPELCYFDMTPPQPCPFSPFNANEILGHPRASIIACLELLPGFYWTVLQTVTGFIHTGAVTMDGFVVADRGLAVANRYLASLSPSGWRSLNVRSLTLLLVTLQAIPSGIAVGDALAHEGSFLMKDPFRLVLRFRPDAPSTYYFFARPEAARARNLSMLPELLTETLTLDENSSPGDSDWFATLQFSERTNELVWSGRCSARKPCS